METNGWKMMAVAGFAALGGMVWCQLLSPSVAVGYPSGAAVSYGANPIESIGGSATSSSSSTAWDNSSGADDVVITDIVLALGNNTADCYGQENVWFVIDGETVGHYLLQPYAGSISNGVVGSRLALTLSSGIRVPAGEILEMHTSYSTWGGLCSLTVYYSLHGYHAAP